MWREIKCWGFYFFLRLCCFFVFVKSGKWRTQLVPSGRNWVCTLETIFHPDEHSHNRLQKRRTVETRTIPLSRPTSVWQRVSSLSVCTCPLSVHCEMSLLEIEKEARKQARTSEQLAAAAVEIGLGRGVVRRPKAVKIKSCQSFSSSYTQYRCVQVIMGNPHFSNCKHSGWEIHFARGENRPMDWSKPSPVGSLLARPK